MNLSSIQGLLSSIVMNLSSLHTQMLLVFFFHPGNAVARVRHWASSKCFIPHLLEHGKPSQPDRSPRRSDAKGKLGHGRPCPYQRKMSLGCFRTRIRR